MKRWKNIWILYHKEFQRLKHNPAALMAVGLLVLMALLVNMQTNVIKQQKVSALTQPCLVVYDEAYPVIKHLKRNTNPKLSVKFHHTRLLNGLKQTTKYPKGTDCVAELSFDSKSSNTLNIIFRAQTANQNQAKMHGFTRWLLASTTAFYSDLSIHQRIMPLKIDANTQTKPSLNLGDDQSKAMVSAMLLYSTQFFICCALFISLSANEKEKGVLQALALTTASPRQIFIAKVLFHLTLSIFAACIMIVVLSERTWSATALSLILFIPTVVFSSLGLIATAALIVSFNKTQTAASLTGFCYLMLVGVVFALSKNFSGFAILKELMFENHTIQLFHLIFQKSLTRPEVGMIPIHLIILMLMSLTIVVLSSFIWSRKTSRNV